MTDAKTMSIELDYDLPHPPEKVWRALTDAEVLAKWLMTNDLEPEVGHRFTFQAPPIPGQWDGKVACEVLEVVPLERLSYSWQGGSDKLEGYGGRIDTVVTWTLAPDGNGGTRLHLSHSGFTEANRFAFDNLGSGWRTNVAKRMGEVLAAG